MEAVRDGADPRGEYSVKMRVRSVRQNLADESALLCFNGGVSLHLSAAPSLSRCRPREEEGHGAGQGEEGGHGGGYGGGGRRRRRADPAA